jgi:hypothetical protein
LWLLGGFALAKQVSVELTDKEKQELLKLFEQMDTETLKATFEAISMMVRAFEGRPIEPQDIITRLTNVKNILERSRFPTYPLLAKQVYLRLIALYNPQAYPCKDWADLEAEALISYKGQSRAEYVEMTRAAAAAKTEQEFYFGEMPRVPVGEKKRFGFLRRKPQAKEQSEFEYQ